MPLTNPGHGTNVNDLDWQALINAVNANTAAIAAILAGLVGTQARAISDLTVTGTVADVPGASLPVTTNTANATAVIIGTFDCEVTAAVTGTWAMQGQCTVDGVAQTGVATFEAGAGTRASVTQIWTPTLATTGPHTLRLRALRTGTGGTVMARGTHTCITAVLLDF